MPTTEILKNNRREQNLVKISKDGTLAVYAKTVPFKERTTDCLVFTGSLSSVFIPFGIKDFDHAEYLEITSLDMDDAGNKVVCVTRNLNDKTDIRISLFTKQAGDWTHEYLEPSEYMKIGTQVAISGDGYLIVISTPYYGSSDERDLILANILVKAKGTSHWGHVGCLRAPNTFSNKVIASSLSVNYDATVVAVGTCGKRDESTYTYVFRRDQKNKWQGTTIMSGWNKAYINTSTVIINAAGTMVLIAPDFGDVYAAIYCKDGSYYVSHICNGWDIKYKGLSDKGDKILIGYQDNSTKMKPKTYLEIYDRDKNWTEEKLYMEDGLVAMDHDGNAVMVRGNVKPGKKAA